jgi:hypothetical protein
MILLRFVVVRVDLLESCAVWVYLPHSGRLRQGALCISLRCSGRVRGKRRDQTVRRPLAALGFKPFVEVDFGGQEPPLTIHLLSMSEHTIGALRSF